MARSSTGCKSISSIYPPNPCICLFNPSIRPIRLCVQSIYPSYPSKRPIRPIWLSVQSVFPSKLSVRPIRPSIRPIRTVQPGHTSPPWPSHQFIRCVETLSPVLTKDLYCAIKAKKLAVVMRRSCRTMLKSLILTYNLKAGALLQYEPFLLGARQHPT